jgi:hypothetical protein
MRTVQNGVAIPNFQDRVRPGYLDAGQEFAPPVVEGSDSFLVSRDRRRLSFPLQQDDRIFHSLRWRDPVPAEGSLFSAELAMFPDRHPLCLG